MIGGLAYGARRWTAPPAQRFLTLLLALTAVPLPFAQSLLAMGAFCSSPGLTNAPLRATEYGLIGALAPEGTVMEADSWQIVANVMGSAAGAFLAGILIDQAGVDSALASASISCGIAVLVALAGGEP